ncbi:MAG: hypothetical protein ABI193_10305 [Minicystis sp.]
MPSETASPDPAPEPVTSAAAAVNDGAPAFRAGFQRWSRRVRSRLALSRVLTGAAIGLLIGAGVSAAAWQTRHGSLRPSGAAAGLLGAAVGLFVARKKRWSDPHVALYLDGKLDADEAISTAVEMETRADDERPARAVVLSQATQALAGATRKRVRAPMLRPVHLALPLAAAAIVWVSTLPLPPAKASTLPPPGSDKVQLAQVAGLEKIIKLGEVDARDEAQKERLKKLAEEARRIREKLREGAEKREVQADIAKLRDSITAERLSLGDGQQRAGMESALGKLGENPNFKDAEKALGDRDLVKFDEEMERLANKLEKNDREQAKKTLEDAAEAAKKAGAPDVAKELEKQKQLLDERSKKGEKLRELAKELGEGLPEEGKEALKDFAGSGSGKDQQKLAEELDKALGKMTPEQRKQLAENLKKKMAAAPEEGGGKGPSKKQLKEMADQLGTPEGQKQLEDELKKMAEEPAPGSEEAERQKQLGEAEEGAGEAEGEVNGTPMPMPVAGQGEGKDGKDGKDGKGEGQAGHSEGGGPGDHAGQTGVIEGGDLKSRANAKINKGKPMPGRVMGRSAGKAGDTANLGGTGALGQAAPGEIGGVERSDVPEEYREQVGRYFQPK